MDPIGFAEVVLHSHFLHKSLHKSKLIFTARVILELYL